MTENLEIYKCNVCGNVIQVLLSGVGEPVCCGQPMNLQTIQHDKSEVGEKHAPVIEERNMEHWAEIKSHPMIPEHYIQFIEVFNKDKSEVRIKFLRPGSTAEMNVNCMPDDINAIEFCNIHGLWGENNND